MNVRCAIFFVLATTLADAAIDSATQDKLLVYAGAASKPATEEIARLYEEQTGTRVELIFGGSGFVLSQMKLAKTGDIYFPGSSDFMELAKREGLVYPDSERIAVYLAPAINVWRGNPRNIQSLEDLLRPDLRVVIAAPKNACVGAYAVEIIERAFTPEQKMQFRRNLVNYTESCEKTATAISLKMADAAIGWRVFEHWDPDRIQSIPLPPERIPRIGYIPIAVSVFTRNRQAAESFLDFVTGEPGRAVFNKFRYFSKLEEAARAAYGGAEPSAPPPVGGEYVVPDEWTSGNPNIGK